jgi:KaiC/GvpD/RAD55 family RecA-like ATPase
LIVMKSRGSKHSEQFHEFRITDRGIELANP